VTDAVPRTVAQKSNIRFLPCWQVTPKNEGDKRPGTRGDHNRKLIEQSRSYNIVRKVENDVLFHTLMKHKSFVESEHEKESGYKKPRSQPRRMLMIMDAVAETTTIHQTSMWRPRILPP